jgi:glycerophosphoryl diester phosphodiesterase
VRSHGLQNGVLLSSFLPGNLARARRLLPGVPTGQLTSRGMAGRAVRAYADSLAPYDALHPHFTGVTAALVEREHRRGRQVNVWTVNDPDEMRRLFALGVDGIISDYPAIARQVLKEIA